MKPVTFSLIAAFTLALTAFDPADASAQYRPVPGYQGLRPGPVQVFPQVQNSNIQQTMNYAYMNEMSKRASSMYIAPNYYNMYQPFVYPNYGYNYSYGYMYNTSPFVPAWRYR